MSLLFGNVPHPHFVDRLIPSTANTAWDDLGPRKPVGVCQHTMVGTLWGTDTYFRTGAHALTDYGIGGSTDGEKWDGVILRWNDPRGRRAGWANGGSDGLEGDGPLFVRTLGISAINRDLVSIERSDGGDITALMSSKQFESICQLTAHWFDQAQVPWKTYPVNPHAGSGIVTHMLHREFATKGCPWPAVADHIDAIQNRVRAILKAAQTGTLETIDTPPPAPITPDHDWWPKGYDVATLKIRFGKLTHHDADGTTREFGFDPSGAISNAWVARAAADHLEKNELPTARDWWRHSQNLGAIDLITFDRGWTLIRTPESNSWHWLS